MKQIIVIFLSLSAIYSQSLYANLTIYKDGYALVKQPVFWEDVDSDQNVIIWDVLPKGVVYNSPFLSLENANVLIQSFNKDVFHFSERLYDYLGTKVDIKLINSNDMSGTLIEVTDKILTIQRRRSLISFNRDRVDYINVPSADNVQFKPTLKWTIQIDQEADTIAGDLTYLASGFSWNANYRFIIDSEIDEAQFIAEAAINNDSNINFENAALSLVEGKLNMNEGADNFPRSITNQPVTSSPERSELGDYHIFNIDTDMSLITKETIITRLYPSRNVSFVKTYIFENEEKSQKDEPLSVEYDIPNTSENNLGIPLPKGEIQLYQLLENGTIEFIGKDEIRQIPRNETANISSGKAFDVLGTRKILNYDRQQKSEEASIAIQVKNSQMESISVRLAEHIYGDWVIRNASTDYRKVDASTIHFMISVPGESSRTVTYTYRKEWK